MVWVCPSAVYGKRCLCRLCLVGERVRSWYPRGWIYPWLLYLLGLLRLLLRLGWLLLLRLTLVGLVA